MKPQIRITVISGVEGPCLAVEHGGQPLGGTRVAGPKPWGGGRTIHEFLVDPDKLIDAINAAVATSERRVIERRPDRR